MTEQECEIASNRAKIDATITILNSVSRDTPGIDDKTLTIAIDILYDTHDNLCDFIKIDEQDG